MITPEQDDLIRAMDTWIRHLRTLLEYAQRRRGIAPVIARRGVDVALTIAIRDYIAALEADLAEMRERPPQMMMLSGSPHPDKPSSGGPPTWAYDFAALVERLSDEANAEVDEEPE